MSNAITPEHIHSLTHVSSPSLSPDGERLVFVMSKIDRERMEEYSQIMILSLPNGQSVTFTRGRKDSLPIFSPDGDTVAFIRPDEGKRKQLWLIPVSGGEARQLTDAPGGVSDHAWSPDRRRLAFVSRVDPNRPPDDHDPKADPKTQVARRIRYRTDGGGWQGDAFDHLFIVDAHTGETRQLTDGEGDDSAPVWSPDGQRIAFISDRVKDRDIARHTEVHAIPVEGGERQVESDGLCSVGSVAWSPDGRRLAVTGSHDAEVWDPRQGWLYILEPDRPPRQLTDGSYTPVQPAPDLRWTKDGRILFIADKQGESFLCQQSAEGGSLETLAGGGGQFLTVTLDRPARSAVVAAASPDSPGDLLRIDMEQPSQTRLTACNQPFFDLHPPATMEKFTLSRAGEEIQSRVLLPTGFDPTGLYPLVLDIHGGPNGRFSDSFDITQQVLVSAGYIVLAVNPRGSSSYGPEFMKAVLKDWGGEDFLDLMAAMDDLCSRPYIDTARLGVHGYSYGGFMSSWIVGHDTRFRAAVVGAPCINLHSMYGTSDIGVSFGEVQWGGSPQNALDALLEHSPLTYAPNVQTPVLLLHGEEDFRCPIEQSEQYFVALKRLGKEVEFVRFPGSAHGFRRSGHPKLREEYLQRMVAWFNSHLA